VCPEKSRRVASWRRIGSVRASRASRVEDGDLVGGEDVRVGTRVGVEHPEGGVVGRWVGEELGEGRPGVGGHGRNHPSEPAVPPGVPEVEVGEELVWGGGEGEDGWHDGSSGSRTYPHNATASSTPKMS
jgi:hypothetical protein